MFASFVEPTHVVKQLNTANKQSIILFTSLDSMSSAKPEDMRALDKPVFIPNSILFDFKNIICDQQSQLSNMMPSQRQFEEQVSALGIKNSDEIYIYDDFGNFCASRVWFMFKCMGHAQVKVIDGGLVRWLDLGLETTETLSSPMLTSNYKADKSEAFQFVDSHYVKTAIDSENRAIIDARGADRFNGQVTEKRTNLRSGHIPSSHNIHYAKLQSREGMHNIRLLREIFTPYLLKDELIFSCGSGVTACILAQCIYEVCVSTNQQILISVYDGSWSEWGADEQFEIEV